MKKNIKYECLGGYVTSPKSYEGKNNKINPYGLFSEQIFGPINSYCCSLECKNYSEKSLYEDTICPKCGGICSSNHLRFTTYGKIKTTFPIIKPTRKKKILKIIGSNNSILLNTKRTDYLSSTSRYIGIKFNYTNDDSYMKIFNSLESNDKYLIIPFRITGLFSLYIILRLLYEKTNIPIVNELFDNNYITKELTVIPANLRMEFFNYEKKILRNSKINTCYTKILVYEEKYRKIREKIESDEHDIIEKIYYSIKNNILNQDVIEPHILEYDIQTSKYQFYVNELYDLCTNELSGKKGLVRSAMISKNIDFCARTVIRSDPSLSGYQVKVSKHILKKVWAPYFLYYLTNIKNIDDIDYCCEQIEDDKIIKNEFNEFLDWFLNTNINNEDLNIKRNYAYLNRRPTLTRHGIQLLEIIPEDESYNTIGMPHQILEQYNADHDGDALDIYFIHDVKSIKESIEKASILNTIYNDSNNEILYKIRHESLYAAYILSNNCNIIYGNNTICEINSLDFLFEDIEYYNNNLYSIVKFNNEYYTYGICLLNKWCGFDKILINQLIDKKTSKLISNEMYNFYNDNKKFHDKLSELNKKLLTFISLTNYCPSFNIDDILSIVDEKSEKLFSKLPNKNVELGYIINDSIINNCINNLDNNSNIYNLYKSGSRFNKQQLSRSCINIGYVSDYENFIVDKPIKTNLLKGMTEEDFFLSARGARKGISDKDIYTPDSGYTERALTMALSVLEIDEDDCCSNFYLKIKIINSDHCKSLIGKYFKINSNDDLIVLTYDIAKENIGKEIYIRSPMTCQTKNFKLCKKCFGERSYNTKYVGIIAGQCLSANITQATMRTFHTSGSALLNFDKELIKFFEKNLEDIIYDNNEIIILFKTDDIHEKIKEIKGFIKVESNKAFFQNINEQINNIDTIQIMKKIKNILRTQNKVVLTPSEYYDEFMNLILEVDIPYSSFVEMLFANMFVCDKKYTKFWRYNTEEKIIKKLGDKNLTRYIKEPLFSLFQPNKKTLSFIKNINNTKQEDLSIYEKMWIGKVN